MCSTPPDSNGPSMMWWSARHPPADPTTSFAGKTVLITGANAGLGFEAAVKFAKLRASRLIFGVRSLNRGEEARIKICQQTGYNKDNIQLYELDMSTFSSVKQFAEAVSEESRLDIAVLNAGMIASSYKASPEGYEMTLQVNVLSTALLGILLLPHLRQSAIASKTPSRLEFVGSIGGRAFDVKKISEKLGVLDQVTAASFFGIQSQYFVSKMLLFYIVEGLVAATSSWTLVQGGPDVIINTVCPGPCRTDLGRDFPAWMRSINSLIQSGFARSAEQGSRSLVSGVALGKEVHGELWSCDMFLHKGDSVRTPEGKVLQQRAWQEMVDVLKPHIPDGDLALP